MKTIDILVEELPKRGGWPDDSDKMRQSQLDCEIYTNSKLLPDFYVGERAEDNGNGVTREQYEVALAAKNDGWIEWGGGECPVSDSTMVEVRYRNGEVRAAAPGDFYEWGHGSYYFVNTGFEIIAYRLHHPQQAEQPEASEEDLNECIGQDATPAWSGEGLPPVGCECEYSRPPVEADSFGSAWKRCFIRYVSFRTVVIQTHNDELSGHPSNFQFRPPRTEAEQKRGAAVGAIFDVICKSLTDESESTSFAIYDAIAAGKIPGVKLED